MGENVCVAQSHISPSLHSSLSLDPLPLESLVSTPTPYSLLPRLPLVKNAKILGISIIPAFF